MPAAPPHLLEMAALFGRGGTILTGNQRAARTLRLAYDRYSQASGLATWQPPPIHAWDTWIATLYRQLLLNGHASRVVLNRSQELYLWRSIISADPQWASLRTVDSLADLASTAWQLLCAYRGRSRLRSLAVSEDTRSFQRWAQAFGRRCQNELLLPAAELEEILAGAFAAGKLAVPASEILLVGFDAQTPAQQLLIATLRESGSAVSEATSAATTGLLFAAADDPASELRQAALWLRSFLLENPEARAAVILPDLAERREIDRVFRQVLAPEGQHIAPESNAAAEIATSGPYEFSLGRPLAAIPLAVTALDILRLVAGPLPFATLSQLLLSPYFTVAAVEDSELAARAEFDAFDLRKSRSLRPEITLDRLIALADGSKRASRLSALRSQLGALHRTAAKIKGGPSAVRRPFSAWSSHMRELLDCSGWALLGRLDSAEFQARRKWESALDELATLDLLDSTPDARPAYPDAVASLQGILERTLFAPESRDAPVQIMSPLEAAGSRFDALWFLRASDLDWPTRPNVHPLLGWGLQHDLAIPGSDPALDFAHAARITNRLAASAAVVVFSYARQTANSRQRPSPLLAALGLVPLAIPADELHHAIIALDTIEESTFVPLANLKVHGGADILKLQSACAFRAFAEKRLRSSTLENPQAGMDARESGNIIHKALEHLWATLRLQSTLRGLTSAERSAQLSRSIDHSLARARALLASDNAATPWDDAYLELQRKRLHRLLTPWLDLELNRAAFEVVLREENETASIGPLTVEIRIDRVDHLLDQPEGDVLIDYKTGNPQPRDWLTERPDEPQLPLYAVLRSFGPAPKPVAAVAFARIRAGREMALHGYESRDDLLGKAAKTPLATLDNQITDWQRILTVLAEDFAAGDTRVLPKKYPETCKYCPQRLLCRLNPATLLPDPDELLSTEEDYA